MFNFYVFGEQISFHDVCMVNNVTPDVFQEQMELGVVTGYCLIDGMIDHQTEGGGGHWEEGTVIKRGGEED